jgi:hypothetical protein
LASFGSKQCLGRGASRAPFQERGLRGPKFQVASNTVADKTTISASEAGYTLTRMRRFFQDALIGEGRIGRSDLTVAPAILPRLLDSRGTLSSGPLPQKFNIAGRLNLAPGYIARSSLLFPAEG